MVFPLTMVSDLTGFGAAGLMGALWLWERRLNRQREEQLDEAHSRVQRDEQRLDALTDALERNTTAFVQFSESQQHFDRTMANLIEELRHARHVD